jgi:hypothetical protein
LDIDYLDFEKDIKATIEHYLLQNDFTEANTDNQPFTKNYVSKHWCIEISMINYFPHISPSFKFSNLSGEHCLPGTLNKLLKIEQNEVMTHYNDFKKRCGFDTQKIKMVYICEMLELFYKPLIIGSVVFADYQDFCSN